MVETWVRVGDPTSPVSGPAADEPPKIAALVRVTAPYPLCMVIRIGRSGWEEDARAIDRAPAGRGAPGAHAGGPAEGRGPPRGSS